MSKYKSFEVRGTKRYMKEGRLVKESSLPPHILKTLQNVSELDDAIPEQIVSDKCIFCGEFTKLTRALNLWSIAVCEEHYQNKTVGETVKQYKEAQNA